jgi:hypothetical protein
MTCRWRAVPKSFKANNDRTAQAAGTMSDPGKPLRARTPSRSAATKSGRNRNRPPNLVWRVRGARSSWRTSATSAVTRKNSVRRWSQRMERTRPLDRSAQCEPIDQMLLIANERNPMIWSAPMVASFFAGSEDAITPDTVYPADYHASFARSNGAPSSFLKLLNWVLVRTLVICWSV